jgi:hypothetical protein
MYRDEKIADDLDLFRLISWIWGLRFYVLFGTVAGLVLSTASISIIRSKAKPVVKTEVTVHDPGSIGISPTVNEVKALFLKIDEYQMSGYITSQESIFLHSVNEKLNSGEITMDLESPHRFNFNVKDMQGNEDAVRKLSISGAVNLLISAQDKQLAARQDDEKSILSKMLARKLEIAQILQEASKLTNSGITNRFLSEPIQLGLTDYASVIFAAIPDKSPLKSTLMQQYINEAASYEILERELTDMRKLVMPKKFLSFTKQSENFRHEAPLGPPFAGVLAIGLIFGSAAGLFLGAIIRYLRVHLPQFKKQYVDALSPNFVCEKSSHEGNSRDRPL